jgi:putative hydrolase of the HAD superfamily
VTELRALVVDYGGVMTTPLQDAWSLWAESDGIDVGEVVQVLRETFGSAYADEAAVNPVHALERGEMEVPDFERVLAAHLRTRDGRPVPAEGLVRRMFAGFRPEPLMVTAVRAVRAAGRQTALLSNSWGVDYPRAEWPKLFDVVVISGDVGMRKPEPAIYLHVARLMGRRPEECLFVDDLPSNVAAAEAVGMWAIRHVSPEDTVRRLEARFGVQIRAGDSPQA